MEIEKNKLLKPFNTFGIACTASLFVSITSEALLKKVIYEYKSKKLFILGGGSNLLLTKNIDALVLHIALKGISIISENETHAIVEAKAGENWHEFVLYCIEHQYGGVENLSLIPGNVGTAPIQNIGAYGVELKDMFESCEAIEIKSLKKKTFTLEDCKFDYRDSIFKNEAKGKYIITSVRFKLTKKNHTLHTNYGAIKDELLKQQVSTPDLKSISQAVIAIRQSKLPDPKEIGNSGSFFKNPVVSKEVFEAFVLKHPEAPFYEVSATEYKIPAGWLIEQAGYKGKRFGDAGIHSKQALVLVNYGNATGAEIWQLAVEIQQKVKELFGIIIEPEVNVI